jgi:UDP-GlcNAc:undecaprenyl-phosphate GlcNAc-1-phosphate transferase
MLANPYFYNLKTGLLLIEIMLLRYLWNNATPTILSYFLFALLFCFIFNALFYKFASNLGIRDMDENDHMRWSRQSKPSIGGITFYIVFLLSIFGYVVINPNSVADPKFGFDLHSLGFTLAITVGFLIGLADDAYNTNPILKLIGQFFCANILIMSGYVIWAVPNHFMINYFISTLWIVGLMNSINLLDNMDGAAGSVSLCIIGACIILLNVTGHQDDFMKIVLFGVMASLIAFLYFNIYPSKIFMGDTGSQFLGVFLAGISIQYLWKFNYPGGSMIQVKQFIVPAMFFIIPLTDTVTVFFWRIKRGQSPSMGGTDHITHHLFYNGLNERQVLMVLSFITLISGALAIWIISLNEWTIMQIGILITYSVIVFALFQFFYIRGASRKALQLAKE